MCDVQTYAYLFSWKQRDAAFLLKWLLFEISDATPLEG